MKEEKQAELNMELGAQLFLQIEGSEIRIKCNLVGVLPQSCLMIQTPLIKNKAKFLNKDDDIIIRYIHHGKVLGFLSKVIESLENPFDITYISYPKKVEEINLRKHSRIVCYIPAKLKWAELSFKGVVSDISEGGVRFITIRDQAKETDNFRIGDELTVVFPLLGMEDEVEFKGKIRSINTDVRILGIGVEFENLPSNISDKLSEYIKIVSSYNEHLSQG